MPILFIPYHPPSPCFSTSVISLSVSLCSLLVHKDSYSILLLVLISWSPFGKKHKSGVYVVQFLFYLNEQIRIVFTGGFVTFFFFLFGASGSKWCNLSVV
ncbi:hypothetical protein YC2023_092898 [Brassica napus]